MQKSYWTHHKSSRAAMIVTLALALAGVGAVEFIRLEPSESIRAQKAAAASLAAQMMRTIKEERLARGIPIDEQLDPTESGMIGLVTTVTTSNNGHLPAKQTTVNPNWAAVIIEMLYRGGVQPGDTVAVGMSGSFPALNLCTLAALKTMGCQAVVISSAAGSQFGANHPDFLWVDMEQTLHERGLIDVRSIAASLGGEQDVAAGMSDEGIEMVKKAIDRAGVPFLETRGYFDSLNKRLKLYNSKATQPVAAYINVGGGAVSVGTYLSKGMFRPGLNQAMPNETVPVDSVMSYYLGQGVPVIHLSHVETIALRYGLPAPPLEFPRVAVEDIEAPPAYSPWVAAGALALVVASLYLPPSVTWLRNRRNGQPLDRTNRPRQADSEREFVEASL